MVARRQSAGTGIWDIQTKWGIVKKRLSLRCPNGSAGLQARSDDPYDSECRRHDTFIFLCRPYRAPWFEKGP
jgi:hypothetical protein